MRDAEPEIRYVVQETRRPGQPLRWSVLRHLGESTQGAEVSVWRDRTAAVAVAGLLNSLTGMEVS